ncbi:hypothetical protein AB0D78_20845 [Streptomyces avermitilis]|uniref:hypothetical protein n=1 Tax=Streptomyces avermitilis TaxID=33903 RepID=UPI0033FADBF0
MHREDTPDTATKSGLSTEDLAQPRDRTSEGTAVLQPDAPAFPGESTPTASDSDEDERGAVGADSGTRTEAAADVSRTQDQAGDAGSRTEDEGPQLLTPDDEEGFRERWQEVQSKFVDDPRDAVHTADALVSDVMQRLAATFADHKQELEGQWNRGEQADTEDLRIALHHYRSFFNRLLIT